MNFILTLNSCSKVGVIDMAQGEIGDSQRAELDQLLTRADANIPRLVFLHHIPNRSADFESIMTLRDWEQLMEIVKGRVNALAFGHQGKDLEIEVKGKMGKKLEYRPMEVQSLTVPLTRGPHRNIGQIMILDANSSVKEQSYYHIKAENNTLSVTVEELDNV